MQQTTYSLTITTPDACTASESVLIRPEIAGRVVGLHFQEGRPVHKGEKMVSIDASEVNILEARNLSAQQQEQRFKQTGVSLTLTNPIVSAVQTAQRMNKAAERTDDKRMKTLAALSTAWSANDAYTQVMADPAAAGGINLSIALGMNKSESKSEQTSNTAAASTVAAGGDVTIVSSGGTRNNDLTVQGSEITAGNNALLKADGNILLAPTTPITLQALRFRVVTPPKP